MFFGADMIDPFDLVIGGGGEVKCIDNEPVKKGGQILVWIKGDLLMIRAESLLEKE